MKPWTSRFFLTVLVLGWATSTFSAGTPLKIINVAVPAVSLLQRAGNSGSAEAKVVHAAGVLDRHPRVKIVMAEAGLAWVPSMIQGLDFGISARATAAGSPVTARSHCQKCCQANTFTGRFGSASSTIRSA